VEPAAGVAVDFLGDVVAWFTDGSNWSGEDGMPHRLWEHTVMCVLALVSAALVALPIGMLIGHSGRGGALAINVANLGRAIPSFAIIVLSAQYLEEIGAKPAYIALVALAIPPMVTNTLTAIEGVDPEVKESALGMGLTGPQVLTRVEVPMGMPLIMAGVRTSGVQIVATATLAALVGWGGLGRYIIDGLATRDFVEVFAGAFAVAVMSIVAEVLLGALQARLVPKGLRLDRGRAAPLVALEPDQRTALISPAAGGG
jgi:osmoprotectant transport system permease protein